MDTVIETRSPTKRFGTRAAVVEEPKFHPRLTGRENLKIGAAARDRAAEGRIPSSLERIELTQLAHPDQPRSAG
jgi:ABC-type multidrug transport system ATPase subunit